MVGRHSADLRGELGSTRRTELVGVELEPQAGSARRGDNRSRLVDREHARLAEDVRKPGEPLRRDAGEHRRDEQANVFGTAFRNLAVLERYFVGAEPRRNEPHGKKLTQSPDDAQRFELVVRRKPIAGFYFDGRDPVRCQAAKARECQRDELILFARPQIAHRRVNSAPASSDLHVVQARGAELLLLEPRFAEDRVCVRVDEAWREEPATAIDLRKIRVFGLELGLRPDVGDRVASYGDGDAGHNSSVAHLTSAARPAWSKTRDDL